MVDGGRPRRAAGRLSAMWSAQHSLVAVISRVQPHLAWITTAGKESTLPSNAGSAACSLLWRAPPSSLGICSRVGPGLLLLKAFRSKCAPAASRRWPRA